MNQALVELVWITICCCVFVIQAFLDVRSAVVTFVMALTVVGFLNGCGASTGQPREIIVTVETPPPGPAPVVSGTTEPSDNAAKADDRRHSWNPCTERRWFEIHDAHTPDAGRWLMTSRCGADEAMLRGTCVVEEGNASELISSAQLSTDKSTEGGWSCAYRNDADEPITVAIVLTCCIAEKRDHNANP